MFGRATITLGIGPHSSLCLYCTVSAILSLIYHKSKRPRHVTLNALHLWNLGIYHALYASSLLATINLRTEFEVYFFTRSRDMLGLICPFG